jgi:multisubunit Na+/H+ antiporter MnhE subunit
MRVFAEVVAWWAVLLGVWLMSLNAFSFAELITATALALPGAFAARAARIAASGSWRVRPRQLRWLLHLLWAILHDTVAVLRLPAGGKDEFSEMPVSHGGEAPATAVVSAAPGSVVVDAEDDTLLVHRLPIGETGLTEAVRE